MSAVRTLRFRLMAWNAGVVILTAVTTLLIVREGVRYSLLREMDQVLAEDLTEIGMAVGDSEKPDLADLREGLNRKALGHVQHGWFVQLSEGSRLLWSSENTPASTPRVRPGSDASAWSSEGLRLLGRTFDPPGRGPVTVRVGASLRFLEADMERIDRLTILGTVVVLVVGPLGGYWLAGRATRTIDDITRTAARLRPARLTERLPLSRTGDELDRLSLTINGLLDRIAEYLSQRRDFIANAAHELRTPLAAIRSSVEVALNEPRSQIEYDELLHELIAECSSLEVLVNQLLLLAESDADRLRIYGERINFTEVAERSADMFHAVAESRGIVLALELERDVCVEGNRPHLRQVLNNLLDNALKFTPEGGRVLVRLESRAPHGPVTLTVEDTGCGIAPEDLPHVFERFYRSDKSRRRDGISQGTGLGLSICQAIVAAHKGEITARSTAQGATFEVKLPGVT